MQPETMVMLAMPHPTDPTAGEVDRICGPKEALALRYGFEALMGGTVDGVALLDANGRILRINPAADLLLAQPSAEIVGRRLVELPLLPMSGGELDLPATPGAAWHGICRGRREDGALSPLEVIATRIGEGPGPVFLLLFRLLDDGGRSLVDIARARFAAVVLAARDGIIIITHEGVIETFNPAAAAIFGYSAGEVIGRPIEMLMPQEIGPEHRSHVAAFRKASVAGRTAGFSREVRAKRKDGSVFPLDLVVLPTVDLGQRFFAAIVRDLSEQKLQDTQRKELEAGMERRSRRLEVVNLELDQFASMASHDLRAPLRQIGILSDWILRDLGDNCPESVRLRMAQLRERLKRLDSLVEGLRRYASVGGQDQQRRAIDPLPMLREAVELADPGPRFTIEMPSNLPLIVASDAALAIVLRNLVANAVRHHDREDGKVRIHAIEREEEVEIVVEDDGPGNAEELRDRALDLFGPFRGDGEVSGGIGLAIVRRMLTTHGGRLEINPSTFGRGVAVAAVWPRAASAA